MLPMSLPLADVTAFGHPGGGMDMESLASSLKGNPMLQQAMADNPEMQELLNNPAALQEKMAATQAHTALPAARLPRPAQASRSGAPLPACTAGPAQASYNAACS